jgi:hypothetical protein
MGILRLLHSLVEGGLLPFIDDFHLETKVTLDQETFIFALVRSPRLFSSGPSNMVYGLLRNCFVPYDYVSGFDFFFEVFGHIAQNHVPPSISHLFFAY